MEDDTAPDGVQETPADTKPAGTVADPSTEPPPARDDFVPRAALLEERRKRQALEAAEAERQRKAAEQRGEWQQLAEQSRQEAQRAKDEAARAARIATAARKLRDVEDDAFDPAVEFALYRYEKLPADERPDFGAFLDSEREGALSRFLAPSKPAPATDDGARATGGGRPPIPDACKAEAEKHGQDPRWWFDNVYNLPHRRKARGEV